MLITALAKNCTTDNEIHARAFFIDVALGLGALIVGLLAYKDQIPSLSSVVGIKMLAAGGAYTLINIIGIYLILKSLPQPIPYAAA